MSDLISRNALLGFISDERKEAADNKNHEKMRGNDYEMHFWSGALVQARWIRQYVNEAPTIDAVPVVRCWECKHYTPTICHRLNTVVKPFDFCSYGKPKIDGGAEGCTN